MNHLAHFQLAGPEQGLRVGALLGDYVKGPLHDTLPENVRRGVRLHRQIDAFTDGHERTRSARARFGARRRLSGIVLDMYFDHYLSLHWPHFENEPLEHFVASTLSVLDEHECLMSPAAQQFCALLREHRLLMRYHDLGFVDGALLRIGDRLTLRKAMADTIDCAREQLTEIESDFLALYPALQQFALDQR